MVDPVRAERSGVVIDLGRYRRAREAPRRDVWIAVLVVGAIVALLVGVARPFEAGARTPDEPRPTALAE